MSRPKFCSRCGGKLTNRDDLADSSWEDYDDCLYCSIRFHTIYGDVMGGSSDQTYQSYIRDEEED